MELTKHEHACVVASKDGASIVIDPGMFSPAASEIIAGADAILVTHEHMDHINPETINAALASRSDLRVYGPDALRDTFAEHPDQFTPVAAGDELKVGSFDVTVHGYEHAVIHRTIPVCANVGYLLDGDVYHPGDAYYVPEVPVTTLLLPTSGPWMKLGEAIDYVLAVKPAQTVEIHDMLLNDIGRQMVDSMLGAKGPAGVPLTSIPVGQSLTV